LIWTWTFVGIALIAVLLGFTGLAGETTHVTWILFIGFLVGTVTSLITARRGSVV
jgi:uncharacterized membrane protein YtjA (UPF0391 family)